MSLLEPFQEELKDVLEKAFIRPIIAFLIAVILFLIFLWNRVPEFWYTIPVAIASVVLTAIFFEAPGFRSFLLKTALEVIQNKKYLEMLNRDNLEKMLEKIHQVYYRLPDELEKGNLYDFVKKNILDYLDKAYEDDVDIEYEIYKKEGEDYVEIKVNKTFKITASSEKPLEGEKEISAFATAIPGKDDAFHFPFDKHRLKVNGNSIGFPEDLKKPVRVEDSIRFLHKQKYQVNKTSSVMIDYTIVARERKDVMSIHQQFLLPTRRFKLRVSVYDFGDCTFSYYFSGSVAPKPDQVREENRTFVLDYNGWMIPGNTVTVHFKPI